MTIWQYFGVALVVLLVSILLVCRRTSEKQLFCNKHVLITGGSSGLGRAVAVELAKKGASITLIARGTALLEESKKLVHKHLAKGQYVNIISTDVTNAEASEEAVKKAESQSGRPVEMVFCCAGAALPGFLLDQPTTQVYLDQMQLNYMGVVNVIQPAIRRMVDLGLKGGRIVMISSTVGLMGMVGYSPYSPTKFALRGLAESLRQELLSYDIGVHVYFVATIKSPGEERENLTKPQITKILEEGDVSDGSPEARAKVLIDGVERNHFSISSDLITELFRACSLGMMPSNNFLLESVLTAAGRVVLPLWQRYADYKVRRHCLNGKKKCH